jgi:hypothetical protein
MALPFPYIAQPVNGNAINLSNLGDMARQVEANLQHLQAEYFGLQVRYLKASQFIEWVMETNPKVIEEFKDVARAVDKLEQENTNARPTP